MKNLKHLFLSIPIVLVTGLLLISATFLPQPTHMEKKQTYYCEYCGKKFPDVRQLTSATCPRHPDGSNKGRHKLYEGSEKQEYTCKYCGKKFPSIQVMTGGQCVNHPKGTNKGPHAPAL